MIPKSLHTVTVLARVAQALRSQAGAHSADPHSYWVSIAAGVLGYVDEHAPDVYGLKARAVALLAKGAP